MSKFYQLLRSSLKLTSASAPQQAIAAARRDLHVVASPIVKQVLTETLENKFTKVGAKMLASAPAIVREQARQAVIQSELNKLKAIGAEQNRFKEIAAVSEQNSVMVTSQDNALDIAGSFSLTDSDVNKIVLGRYLHYLENDPRGTNTVIGNMHNAERKALFMLTEAEMDFDFDKGTFSIGNIEELRRRYNEKFNIAPDSKYAAHDFTWSLEKILDGITSTISAMRRSKKASDYTTDATALLAATKSKVFKSDQPSSEGSADIHIANSLYRHDDALNSQNILANSEFQKAFFTSFMINAVLEDAAKKACGENHSKFFQQMELSQEKGSVAYPRDYSVFCGGKFHQTDPRVAENMAEKRNSPQEIRQLSSHAADLQASGLRSIQDIPFDAKGGNIIITENDEGKKVLIATVSDAYYSDDGKFKGGYMINDRGLLENNSVSMFSIIDKYPLFCDRIKEWGKSIGCDEVVVVDRNLEGAYKNKFNQLYHLDLFCGNLPGGFFVVNPEAIKEADLVELKRVFGEDKIIEMSQEEQKELCANFIIFDKMVAMSSPNTPQSFVEKLNKRGFDVYVPGLYLSYSDTLNKDWPAGVRCFTSTILAKELENGMPETVVEPSAIEKLQERERAKTRS